MRCFISIELPENVQNAIFNSFNQLRKSKTCVGNFVPRKNIHLSLRFFSNLSIEQLQKIKIILSRIDFRKFTIETGDVGFFPNSDYPKVLWVGLVSNELSELRERIDIELRKEGFEDDKFDFVSYVTVARLKSVPDKEKFFEKVEEIIPNKMFFIAESFSLVQSNLTKKGSTYKILEDYGMRIRG
jgi:RNA 2',3'-cyclic 3'-phosphodiesterase